MRNSGRHRRSNPRRSGGGTNRVFESSGPDGKVRGNSQQIIEKYLAYSRDAMLGGDNIVAENYSQHAEHYIRLLDHQKELEAQRVAQSNAKQANGSSGNQNNYKQGSDRQNANHNAANMKSPDSGSGNSQQDMAVSVGSE